MTYRVINSTIAAGDMVTFSVMAKYCRILSSTATVLVGFDDDNMQELPVGVGVTQSKTFLKLRVENTSASANVIKIAVAMGDIADTRFNLDGSTVIPVTIQAASSFITTAAVVGFIEAVVVPLNLTRKSVTIQNLGTMPIYIGGVAVTVADGLKIASGGSFVIDKSTGAISAISGTAGQDVRIFEEG